MSKFSLKQNIEALKHVLNTLNFNNFDIPKDLIANAIAFNQKLNIQSDTTYTIVSEFSKYWVNEFNTNPQVINSSKELDKIKCECKESIDALDNLNDIFKLKNEIYSPINKILCDIESKISNDICSLESAKRDYQNKYDEQQKRYYYLLGLAPLALFGAPALLAAAAIALTTANKWKDEENNTLSVIEKYQSQIQKVLDLKNNIKEVNISIDEIYSSFNKSTNAIYFFKSELENIDERTSLGISKEVLCELFKVELQIVLDEL